MLIIVMSLLGLAAAYSGAAYLLVYARSLSQRGEMTWEQAVEVERNTFHLGLCFILSIGFLGLIAGGR